MAAPINKLENIANHFEADIFLLGHQSKLAAAPINRIYPVFSGTPKLHHKKIVLVGCGSFARGYIERSKRGRVATGSYVEQGMLGPTVLGNPVISITPGKIDGVWSPEITVSL